MNIVNITKAELMTLGYSKQLSHDVIMRAKENLVKKGFTLYDNKQLNRVPIQEVEQILGIDLSNYRKESE